MGFGGNLEDLSVVDVLQLLYATKKSGTLLIQGADSQAYITLNAGFVVSATHPNKEVNIGTVLRENGLVSAQQLEAALEQQRQAGDKRKPILATLIEMGAIEKEPAFTGLRKLIEKTIGDLISWKEGQFTLNVDQITLSDDYGFFPESLSEEINVDTQAVLMNAVRIFDEKNARNETRSSIESADPDALDAFSDESETSLDLEENFGEEPAEEVRELSEPTISAQSLGLDDIDKLEKVVTRLKPVTVYRKETGDDSKKGHFFRGMPEDIESLDLFSEKESQSQGAEGRYEHIALVFSEDGFLKNSIRALCLEDRIQVFTYAVEKDLFERIKQFISQDIIPIIVIDHKSDAEPLSSTVLFALLIKRIKALHPEVPIIQFVGDVNYESFAAFFLLGVRAVLPRPPREENADEYVAKMKTFLLTLRDCFKGIFQEEELKNKHILFARNQMAYLKRKLLEIKKRERYLDFSLTLLQTVSENLERAIIFLVRKDDLIGVGSFGLKLDKGAQLISAMKIKISLEDKSIFKKVVEEGEAYHGLFDPTIGELLLSKIGEPFNPRVLVLPLRTNEKTIAVIYGDFGTRLGSPVQIDALEILASQVGFILENSLLRKQLETLQKLTSTGSAAAEDTDENPFQSRN